MARGGEGRERTKHARTLWLAATWALRSDRLSWRLRVPLHPGYLLGSMSFSISAVERRRHIKITELTLVPFTIELGVISNLEVNCCSKFYCGTGEKRATSFAGKNSIGVCSLSSVGVHWVIIQHWSSKAQYQRRVPEFKFGDVRYRVRQVTLYLLLERHLL